MSSVLEKIISSREDRPYSREELLQKHNELFLKLKIGQTLVEHSACGHSYYCKAGGKKEADINSGKACSKCSVCWKLRRTPKHLVKIAENIVKWYMDTPLQEFAHPKDYDNFELESDFYTWLYKEQFENN